MSISNVAKALFELSLEAGKIDIITYHFDDLILTLEAHPAWMNVMDTPMIALNEKFKMIDALDYDASFLAFLKMLAEKSRMYQLIEIHDEWTKLSRIHQKIAHLHIYSAKPISKHLEESLKKIIAPRFPGRTISLHISVDESLLGGLKIVYQGQSLDRSIAREIQELYTII
jgi:F-type H+-transporting ATPase subunit delta